MCTNKPTTMHRRKALSRRTLIKMGVAGGLIGAAGAGGLALEQAPLTTPFAERAGVVPPPTPSPSPQMPLLVILNEASENPLSAYLIEILRTEGIQSVDLARLADLTSAGLARYPVAVLTEGPLMESHAALFEQYVGEGGALVAMRPSAVLARLLGITFVGASDEGGYLRVVHHNSVGIPNTTFQFHGAVTQTRLAGAELIASQSNALGEPSDTPIIAVHQFGRGRALFWAYDLGRSVALTRQGNPQSINQEHDDIPGLRSTDLFVGWNDLDRISTPQADEQQRLLINQLQWLSPIPLPRLWYFPSDTNTLLVVTGDAHGSYANFVDDVYQRVQRHDGSMSIYYTPEMTGTLKRVARKARWLLADLPAIGDIFEPANPLPTPGDIARWRSQGHEFGMHPYIEEGLEYGYHAYWTQFVKLGYGELVPTVRTHRVLWNGWVDNARIQARYGVRMNLDYYHIGSAVRRTNGEWVGGYLTGSGLPMRFVDLDGAVINVFQQHTHLVDEHFMNVFETGKDMGLDGAAAAAQSIALLSNSLTGAPAAIGMQCHVDPFLLGGERAAQVGRWLDATLSFAAERRIPMLSAERWLQFTEARAAAQMSSLSWKPEAQQLRFDVSIPAETHGDLQLMLPIANQAGTLRGVEMDGAPLPTVQRAVSGLRYAAFKIPTGNHQITAFY